jgi:hypothetical protein
MTLALITFVVELCCLSTSCLKATKPCKYAARYAVRRLLLLLLLRSLSPCVTLLPVRAFQPSPSLHEVRRKVQLVSALHSRTLKDASMSLRERESEVKSRPVLSPRPWGRKRLERRRCAPAYVSWCRLPHVRCEEEPALCSGYQYAVVDYCQSPPRTQEPSLATPVVYNMQPNVAPYAKYPASSAHSSQMECSHDLTVSWGRVSRH